MKQGMIRFLCLLLLITLVAVGCKNDEKAPHGPKKNKETIEKQEQVDLLDEAASYLSLNTAVINESYDIRDQLLKLKAEREALEAQTGTLDGVDAQRNYEQIEKLVCLL